MRSNSKKFIGKKFGKSALTLITIALIITLFTGIVVGADLTEMIKVYRNYIEVMKEDVKVNADNFLYNGTTYVPLRAVAEMLGKKVDWDPVTKVAVISDGIKEEPGIQTEEYIRLYFPDNDSERLWPEIQYVTVIDGKSEAAAVEALITGPVSEELSRSIPEGTELIGLDILGGICTVDFSQEFVDNHWGGSAGEMMTLASIVNTLTGFSTIDKVLILVEGKAGATLGNILLDHAMGRIDLSLQESINIEYDFSYSDHGWTGDFTDLPANYDEELYELEFAHVNRPEPLNTGHKALMLAGSNASDDLFMYVKKELGPDDGIEPETTYQLRFIVEVATDAPAGAVGIGGPPGEAVWFKVGAATAEPVPVEEESMGGQYILLNLDKGYQNDDGENAIRVGDAAKLYNDEFYVYEPKIVDNKQKPLEVTSDAEGRLWIFVGTDSGFEGRTVLYYNSITVELIK
jgi:hypothetical protein